MCSSDILTTYRRCMSQICHLQHLIPGESGPTNYLAFLQCVITHDISMSRRMNKCGHMTNFSPYFLSKSLMTNSWHTYPHPPSSSLDIPSTHFSPTWHTLAILIHMSSICHVQLRFASIYVMSMSCAVHFDAKSPDRFIDTTLRRYVLLTYSIPR